jgi:RNAse (barnase) inhibitor barstar
MKSWVLDGAKLPDTAAVYRKLGEAFGAPDYFGHNPDALWDAITEYGGEPIEIVWHKAARSRAPLGRDFDDIVAVLERAAAEDRIKLHLA